MEGENIIMNRISVQTRPYEFIEKKGMGHPDTLADNLAEELSKKYSQYTLEKFKYILHHNFDKVGLLGGSSFVAFGNGYLTAPIRVLINGRVSTKFGDIEIPAKELLTKWTKEFLKKRLPMIDCEKDIKIHYNISCASSPGKTEIPAEKEGTRKYWFEPRDEKDLKEVQFLGANDTSLGVGFYPPSQLATTVYSLEKTLTSEEFKKKYPWLGSDIKIMASKIYDDVSITMCIPQICSEVKNLQEYKENIENIRNFALEIFKKNFPESKLSLHINTRDDYETGELYFTATGSSIESGDEGLVGRGNRINGLICTTNPYTMEGASGKNPVYHIGKLYSIAAQKLAKKISQKIGCYVEVFLVSQSGRLLIDPWKTIIGIDEKTAFDEEAMREIVKESLKEIPKITNELLTGNHELA